MLSTGRFWSFFDCGGEVKVHATYKSIRESINHVTSKPAQKCLTQITNTLGQNVLIHQCARSVIQLKKPSSIFSAIAKRSRTI